MHHGKRNAGHLVHAQSRLCNVSRRRRLHLVSCCGYGPRGLHGYGLGDRLCCTDSVRRTMSDNRHMQTNRLCYVRRRVRLQLVPRFDLLNVPSHGLPRHLGHHRGAMPIDNGGVRIADWMYPLSASWVHVLRRNQHLRRSRQRVFRTAGGTEWNLSHDADHRGSLCGTEWLHKLRQGHRVHVQPDHQSLRRV